jgi:hypothetical protein
VITTMQYVRKVSRVFKKAGTDSAPKKNGPQDQEARQIAEERQEDPSGRQRKLSATLSFSKSKAIRKVSAAKLKRQGQQEKHASRYFILEKLGEGGFGQAFLVQDKRKPDRAGNSRCVVKQVHFDSFKKLLEATEEADVSGARSRSILSYQ